jgi:outer membrane usher protein
MKKTYRRLRQCFFITGLSLSTGSFANDYFHPDLLRLDGASAYTDEYVSILSNNDMLPGKHELHVFINRHLVDTRNIDFVLDQNEKLYPCLTQQDLDSFGVILPSELEVTNEAGKCIAFEKVPYLSYQLNWVEKSLRISIPQVHIDNARLQRAQEKLWDDGINNFSMNYAFSSYKSVGNSQSYYVNVRPGINIGPWRYRNYSVYNKSNGQSRYNTISNTLSRNLVGIRSEISIGDSYSSSTIFDSYKSRGIKLQSSLEMWPQNSRTYVPAITGVANSDAEMTIEQNGNLIYRNNIPAGPYDITDYRPASMGGNLTVTLREADGTVKTTTVPFVSLPIMEKKGAFKYSFNSGRYIGNSIYDASQYVNQIDLIYGLTQYQTVYGGLLASQNYRAIAFGVGNNFGAYGAVSVDLTQASSKRPDGRTLSGKALRISYATSFASATSLYINNTRYLNTDYLNFQDSVMYQRPIDHESNVLSISMGQPLPRNLGSLNLSASVFTHRNSNRSTSYSVGYNGSHNDISYGLYFNKYTNSWRYIDTERQFSRSSEIYLTINIPLSRDKNRSSDMWASYSASRTRDNDIGHTVNLNGTALNNQLSWGAHQSYGNHDRVATGGVSGAYSGTTGQYNAFYSYMHNTNKNYGYGMSGAVTATSYGTVFSKQLNDSNALLFAPNAKDISVRNQPSTRTNAAGLAILPGVAPYRNNIITLDMSSLPDDVDINSNVISNLFPTKGALILSPFTTKVGHKILLTALDNDIPAGAQAKLADTDLTFTASGFNQTYLISPVKSGQLHFSWQQGKATKTCTLDFDITDQTAVSGLYIMSQSCVTTEEKP